jgi:hypothetical protein
MQNPTDFRVGVIRPIECVKEGFEHIKSDYWLLFAVTLVGALIGGVTMYVLFGAMVCGVFYTYLKKIDGFPVTFDDLWKGMQYIGPGLIVTLVIIVPLIIYYIWVYISLVGALVAGASLGDSGAIVGLIAAVVIDVVIVVLLVCFHTLLMFTFPLIVDRGLGPIQAMKVSARAVLKNMGGVVGMIGVNFALVMVGYAALCVGVYFVIPIMMAGNVMAYRRVFPSLQNAGGYGQPQNFYR